MRGQQIAKDDIQVGQDRTRQRGSEKRLKKDIGDERERERHEIDEACASRWSEWQIILINRPINTWGSGKPPLKRSRYHGGGGRREVDVWRSFC